MNRKKLLFLLDFFTRQLKAIKMYKPNIKDMSNFVQVNAVYEKEVYDNVDAYLKEFENIYKDVYKEFLENYDKDLKDWLLEEKGV